MNKSTRACGCSTLSRFNSSLILSSYTSLFKISWKTDGDRIKYNSRNPDNYYKSRAPCSYRIWKGPTEIESTHTGFNPYYLVCGGSLENEIGLQGGIWNIKVMVSFTTIVVKVFTISLHVYE
jgi:hypothetical protein